MLSISEGFATYIHRLPYMPMFDRTFTLELNIHGEQLCLMGGIRTVLIG
jgi:hypothetical protein